MSIFNKTKTNKEFNEVNINDKYFVDIKELKNENNYPNKINCFASWNLLRCIIEVSHEQYDKNFQRAKKCIIDTQHDIDNKLLPNIYCIETLNDEEFKLIIDRLMCVF